MTRSKHDPSRPAAPPALVTAFARARIDAAGYAWRDVFGPAKSRQREIMLFRHDVIRAVAARWPNCTISSVARALGLDHTSVFYALGLTAHSKGRTAGWSNGVTVPPCRRAAA